MTHVKITRAFLSVFDKTGIEALGRTLARHDVELISTGGTARTLRAAGLAVKDVSEITGFPEMMDGRVKTLHPKVHGGLLALRDNPEHLLAMKDHAIQPIDLLVSNLYPFEATVARGAGPAETIENIDIGGPAMIRGGAKNHGFVAVITDPADYTALIEALEANGGATTLDQRKAWAAKAYAMTAAYDAAIATWFAASLGDDMPERRVFAGKLKQKLRYGENPHQQGAFYTSSEARPGIATARQVQGKELSYLNLYDANAAYELVAEFAPEEGAAVAIIKHANPCGMALGKTLEEAYRLALRCDSVSAFGGIIALNQTIDETAARAITEILTDVIIAPDATAAALEIFSIKKNLRLLLAGGVPDPRAPGLDVRTVAGGYLVQNRDAQLVSAKDLKVVTKRAPSAAEARDMLFAWRVAKHTKSNAVIFAKDRATVGIGAGQMSRLDLTRIGAMKSAEATKAAGLPTPLIKGSAVASDAYYPFADGLIAAAEAGATAVIQPGGSVNDAKVIAAADEHGLAMVFTSERHFRH